MAVIVTHPALRLLFRRKIGGFWRLQFKRFKTPSGAIFALIGLGVFVLWLGGAILGQFTRSRMGSMSPSTRDAVPLLMLMGFVFTIFGAFSFRGLYIPEEELDLLLSAPISRADIVRYRLLSGMTRTAIGALFLGFAASAQTPNPLYGFVGGFLYTLTVPIFGQAVSLAAGGVENRWLKSLQRIPIWLYSVFGATFVAFVILALTSRQGAGKLLAQFGLENGASNLLASPILRAVAIPMKPWAGCMAATSFAQFAPWFLAALAVWIWLFEFTARLDVDFRELTLATSADVAKRLARRRRGGVSAGKVWSTAIGWNVPWLFGRGPFGAIAWRKIGSMVRKASGTLMVSLMIISLITFGVGGMREGGALASGGIGSLFGPLAIATFGTLYLTAGLRFDFREDLERMDVIKSWPVAPWKIFLAMLLPEVALVSVLLDGAIAVRATLDHALAWPILGMLAGLPLFALLWVALDNTVFLFVPVRFVPGQDGSLQNMGRTAVLMIARLVLFGFLIGGAAVPVIVMDISSSVTGFSDATIWIVGMSGALFLLAVEVAFAIWVGGKALARFDVARDRGV